MKKTVNVLWTGGLDSTCRVVELSTYDIIVQPYYMLDKNRKSIKQELQAMESITKIIRNNPNTVCKLNDVIITDIDTISKDSNITKAWQFINSKYSLGIQYDWLARFAKQHNIQLEIGLEKSSRSKALMVLESECKLKELDEDGITDYAIDIQHSKEEASLLFENLLMPTTLWHMIKTHEVEEIKKLGYEEVVTKTWFCHTPIFGLPCGNCNPCKDALNEDMAYRVPKLGIFLGTIRKNILVYKKFLKSISSPRTVRSSVPPPAKPPCGLVYWIASSATMSG